VIEQARIRSKSYQESVILFYFWHRPDCPGGSKLTKVRRNPEVSKSSKEREGFSLRLQQTLRNTHHSPDSPTELARDFNIRFPGRPITVHAARKWLVGEAIPTQDKMRTLAEWLLVPIDWLRFGNESIELGKPNSATGTDAIDTSLMADFLMLDEHHRQIAREMLRILIKNSKQKKHANE
jgi:hypothetical protein